MQRADIVNWAAEVAEDLAFGTARRWLAEKPGRKAVGYLPVYVPREVIHACGMLPIGIHGGGDQIEIIKGDAFYQSYICHLPRSVIELAQSGRLDFLSGVLFPSTCDVIRNLSGVWKLLHPEMYVRYIDVPQLRDRGLAAQFWRHELQQLAAGLEKLSGVAATPERLRNSIWLYNQVRCLVSELYRLRRETPWKAPTEELYVLLRAGEMVPPEMFIEKGRQYLKAATESDSAPKDKCRVAVVGAFCEQPPLGLIKTIERAGCYIVDDDFLLGNRFITADVAETGDPYESLASAFIAHAVKTSVLYEPDPSGKARFVSDRVTAARAEGVIFAAPSFCDPALLDRPMLRAGAEAAHIPCIAFQYAENTGQFQQFREQAGTFSDSIKLWGEANEHCHCACDSESCGSGHEGSVHAPAKADDRRPLQKARAGAANG